MARTKTSTKTKLHEYIVNVQDTVLSIDCSMTKFYMP